MPGRGTVLQFPRPGISAVSVCPSRLPFRLLVPVCPFPLVRSFVCFVKSHPVSAFFIPFRPSVPNFLRLVPFPVAFHLDSFLGAYVFSRPFSVRPGLFFAGFRLWKLLRNAVLAGGQVGHNF
jgi:hypothetical protein